MAVSVPLFLLITLTPLIWLAAAFALVRWLRGSASTHSRKPLASPPPTPVLEESRLAAMAADQAALFSTLEKLTTTVKRLSSRQGMRDVRDRQAASGDATTDPPIGAPKADLYRHYGMAGKVGPAFARAQQEFELEQAKGERTN